MRFLGLILVILGALALAYHGFAYAPHEKVNESGDEPIRERAHAIWIPPVAGGIAIVSGLLLVASAGPRGRELMAH